MGFKSLIKDKPAELTLIALITVVASAFFLFMPVVGAFLIDNWFIVGGLSALMFLSAMRKAQVKADLFMVLTVVGLIVSGIVGAISMLTLAIIYDSNYRRHNKQQ